MFVVNGEPADKQGDPSTIVSRLLSVANLKALSGKQPLIWLDPLFKFLLVGGVSTVVSYGVFALLMYGGLNYATANLGGLVAGVLLSFKAQGTLVFGNTDNRLLLRFVLCWLAIYVFNVLLIGKFISLGIDKFVAGLLSIPWTTVLSYLIQRFLVFGRPRPVSL